MKSQAPLNLNLAEDPLRNKRLFHTFFFFLGGLAVLLFFISIITFYQYKTKNQHMKAVLVRVQNKVDYIKREDQRYLNQIHDLSEKNLPKVESFNHFIFQKSFSWTELLTALEQSLPDTCYIVSISPVKAGDSASEISLKVASVGLEPFFRFVNNLYTMNFNNFKLLREGRDEKDYFVWEISLNYDKTHSSFK